MRRWVGPAVIGGSQLGVGLVVLAVGLYYDWLGKPPGMITVAALVLMGGPGFVWAIGVARRDAVAGRALGARELLQVEASERETRR